MKRTFDVCVVCALETETRAFIRIVSDACKVIFVDDYSPESGPFLYTTIYNNNNEPLTLHLSWLPDVGMTNLALHFKPILREFNPLFAGMTGICAGDERKVKLGDIIIADRAFVGDGGKRTRDENGDTVIEYDVTTWHTPRSVLQFARMFQAWKDLVNTLQRPISMHQQRDWLLEQLLDPHTPRVDDIVAQKQQQLKGNAKDWREIVQKLQTGEKPFLTKQRELLNKDIGNELNYSYSFPYQDPQEAKSYVGAMASGNTVRSDRPFQDIQIPVRKTLAVEMEGAAFYQVVEGFPNIASLLVKGVSDYAGPDKDDSYHDYASEVSAAYMLRFMQEFISSKYGFVLKAEKNTSTPSSVIQNQDTSSMDTSNTSNTSNTSISHSPQAFRIFFSHAPEDKKAREYLEKHLIWLKREKGIQYGYTNSAEAGEERIKERDWQLQHANIILLFISPDYSIHCYDELQQAATLYKAGTRVIPILLRKTANWQRIPFGGIKLGDLQHLPKGERPVDELSRDDAFMQIAESIQAIYEKPINA